MGSHCLICDRSIPSEQSYCSLCLGYPYEEDSFSSEELFEEVSKE